MATRIVIDPGHGGRDLGAVYNGREEKDDNLRLALAVGEILENNGFEVEYTRTTDIFDTPAEKAQKANEAEADYFISFHRNSGVNPNEYAGVQTLVFNEQGIKADLAEQINTNLEKIGFPNLGVAVRPDLAVLRRTEMPALLIEAGFINNDSDNLLFDSRFDEIATAIADAVTETVETIEQGTYYVQTGLFRNPNYANNLANRLWYLGYPAYLDTYREFFRVKVGPYSSMEQAALVERNLRRDGFQTLLINL